MCVCAQILTKRECQGVDLNRIAPDGVDGLRRAELPVRLDGGGSNRSVAVDAEEGAGGHSVVVGDVGDAQLVGVVWGLFELVWNATLQVKGDILQV